MPSAPAARPDSRRRQILAAAALLVVAAGLFLCYVTVSGKVPVTSDGAGNALQAWSMLHGDGLLRGWWFSDVSFYTTELPEYMLVETVRGLTPAVVHTSAALTYVLLLAGAAWLAKGRATGRDGVARMLVAGGIMVAPQVAGVHLVLLSPDHFGSAVPVLAMLLLLDLAPPRWWVPVLTGIILTGALVADRILIVTAVLPLLVVCGARAGRRVARREPPQSRWLELSLIAAGVAVGLSSAILAIISLGGGFKVWPVRARLVTWPRVLTHLKVVPQGLAVLFGVNTGSHAALSNGLGLLHLAGLGLAVWGVGAALWRLRRLGLVDQLLVAAVLINLVAYLFLTPGTLQEPGSVAPDATGNLIISDSTGCRIRMVAVRTGTFYGQAMTAGDIYTVAGDGNQGFSGDGGPASKAEVNFPFGAGVDGAGNLVIADTLNDRLRVIAAASGTFYGKAMTAGHIYTVAGKGTVRYSGDGGPATRAQLDQPGGATVDRAGNWVIADTGNNRIRVVARTTGRFYGQAMTAGDIYTVAGDGAAGFAGDGGPATQAGLDQPERVRVDRAGNLVIADTDSNRIRVVAAATGTFYGQPMTGGDIYTVAGNGGTGHHGDGGPATQAGIKDPEGVAFDQAGNLVIAGGYGNNRIRVVAESTGRFYGQAMTTGDIYTVAGGGTDLAEGIPATDAELRGPGAVAVDHAGNLLISDSIFDNRIRVVAASTGTFYGQAMTAGDIYTVAGGGQGGLANGIPATEASVFHPAGVAVDGAGNLLIAALHDSRIRVVAAATGTFYGQAMTAGDIYTVAGGGKGRVEDGGPATGARLLRPEGVAAGPAGSIVIADTDNSLIRTVTG